jgi:iron complex transport system substrate-binding protein
MKNLHFAGLCALLVLLLACSGPDDRDTLVTGSIPTRIISVVPSATEMLFALGRGDRVIAIGDYDNFPPEVVNRPRIGGLLNPNIEKIIELKPDLVVTYGSQAALSARLQDLGVRLYPFSHGDIDRTLDYILDLGKTVGANEEAQQVVARIRAAFDEVRASAPSGQPSVLLVHNRGAGILGSFYSVGSRAFQHQLISIAGGRNVFGDIDREVLQPSVEEILSRSPDIIVETLPPGATTEEVEQRMRDWRTFENVPAVRNNRIYITSEDYLLVPGPRLDLAARRFGEIIAGKDKWR